MPAATGHGIGDGFSKPIHIQDIRETGKFNISKISRIHLAENANVIAMLVIWNEDTDNSSDLAWNLFEMIRLKWFCLFIEL